MEKWIELDCAPVCLGATNVTNTPDEAEAWNALSLVVFVTACPGQNTKKRKSKSLSDYAEVKGRGGSHAVDDEETRKILSVLLSVIPTLTSHILGLMNKFGLVDMAVCAICTSLDSWIVSMFERFFATFTHSALKHSVRRKVEAMRARTVVDSVRDTFSMNLMRFQTTTQALTATATMCSMAIIQPPDVMVYMHVALQQILDSPFLIMHSIIADILKLPVVDFNWIVQLLRKGHADASDKGDDFNRVQSFLSNAVINGGFLQRAEGSEQLPFVSSPQNIVVDEYLRGRTVTSNNTSLVQCIAAALFKHSSAKSLESSMGLITFNLQSFELMLSMYAEKVFDMSAWCYTLDGGDYLDPCRLFKIFEIEARCPDSFSGNDTYKEPTTRMGTFTSHADGQNVEKQRVSFGVNIVAALMVSALSTSSIERNGTCNITVADKILSHIASLAPPSLTGGSATHILSKTFVEDVDGANCHLVDMGPSRAVHFIRPLQDSAIFREDVSIMPCKLRPYAAEDILHMTQLEACRVMFAVPPEHLTDVPTHLLQPDYNLLRDVKYPVLSYSCTTEIPEYEGWMVHTNEGQDADVVLCELFDVLTHEVHAQFQGSYMEAKSFLMANKTYPLPLILRHNALVWCAQAERYGVIQPLAKDDGAVQQYFDAATSGHTFRGYNVLYSDGQVRRDTAWNVGPKLQALSTILHVKYSALERIHADDENSCPPLPSLHPNDHVSDMVVRAFLRYPEEEPTNPEGFAKVWVFLAKRRSATSKKFIYHVVGVPVTALVNLPHAKAKGWIPKVLDFV